MRRSSCRASFRIWAVVVLFCGCCSSVAFAWTVSTSSSSSSSSRSSPFLQGRCAFSSPLLYMSSTTTADSSSSGGGITTTQQQPDDDSDSEDDDWEYVEFEELTENDMVGSEWLVGSVYDKSPNRIDETWCRLVVDENGKNVCVWGDNSKGVWVMDRASQYFSMSKENLFGKQIWATTTEDYYYMQGTIRGWTYLTPASVLGQWQAKRLGLEDPEEAGTAPWFMKDDENDESESEEEEETESEEESAAAAAEEDAATKDEESKQTEGEKASS